MPAVDCALARPSFNAASATASIMFAPAPTDIWRATNFQRLAFTGVEAERRCRLPRPAGDRIGNTPGLHGAQDALIGQQESKYVFNYPVHSGSRHVAGRLSRRLACAHPNRGAPAVSARSYGLWDVYAARTGSRIRPFLQLSNVTGTSYEEIPRVPMPGRSILGGFELLVFAVAINWMEEAFDSTRGIPLYAWPFRRIAGPGTGPDWTPTRRFSA